MSIHWPIVKRILQGPSRTQVVDDRRSYKRAEILVAALHVADELERACHSKTVGLLLPTSGAFPIAILGCWIAGKTAVPLNYLLKRDELEYVIQDSGCDTIIAVQPMLDFVQGNGGFDPSPARIVRLEDLPMRSVPSPRWPVPAGDDDLAVILYTSGTSGRPKGVMLSHGNIAANIAQFQEVAEFGQKDCMLGVLPQFHSFGMTVLTLTPMTLGCKAVYTARFVPTRILELLREHRPTAFVAIPSMYGALLSAKSAAGDEFDSVRFIVSGGEPLPDAVADAFKKRFGKDIHEGYGLTETSPVTHFCLPWEHRPHSVGRPLPRVRQRIVDINTGRELPPGSEGEIRLKGPNIMKGYYHLPEQTAAAFDEQGWFRTGDIGRVDHEGFLSITGRLKEMLIVGGENVFPREIEEVINRHPAVQASAVVGKHDPMRGEVPVAFVEIRDGSAFDSEDIQRFCRDSIAGYKVPREVHRLDQLPRNPTGKVLRRELAARVR